MQVQLHPARRYVGTILNNHGHLGRCPHMEELGVVRRRFGTQSATWCCPGTADMLWLSPIVGFFREGSLVMLDLFTLHHVSLFVRDVDASATFYATVLGLQEIPNKLGKSHIRWLIIDGCRTVHLIGGDSEPERPRPFSTHVALATRDFEVALARLELHGVTYFNADRQPKEITIRPDGVRQVYFQDPDGHWIEINGANGEP